MVEGWNIVVIPNIPTLHSSICLENISIILSPKKKHNIITLKRNNIVRENIKEP